jgi:hypothetical protein
MRGRRLGAARNGIQHRLPRRDRLALGEEARRGPGRGEAGPPLLPAQRIGPIGGTAMREVPTRWNQLSITTGIGRDSRLGERLRLRPIVNTPVAQATADAALAGAASRSRGTATSPSSRAAASTPVASAARCARRWASHTSPGRAAASKPTSGGWNPAPPS